MKILISGAGIAGLTAAYWLSEYGFQVTILDQLPQFERKGYLIGLRGAPLTVLQRMNLLDRALALGMDSIHHDILSSRGRRINRSLYLSYKEDARGKLPMHRADLHAVLYDAVQNRVDIRPGITIEAVHQHSSGVEVRCSDGQMLSGDLLIGADGVHSSVRRLVFGTGFEQSLNASYAAFIGTKTCHIASAVQFAKGRMSVIYDLTADEFGGVFIFRGSDFAQLPAAARKQALIDLHSASSIRDALQVLPDDTPIFADELLQVMLPRWYDERVVLVGDAAYALSPASGFGGSAAMAGAYILARKIAEHGQAGLSAYDQLMRQDIAQKQKTAARVVRQIVSENPIMIGIRDVLLRLMSEKASYKTAKVDDFGIQAMQPLKLRRMPAPV